MEHPVKIESGPKKFDFFGSDSMYVLHTQQVSYFTSNQQCFPSPWSTRVESGWKKKLTGELEQNGQKIDIPPLISPPL